MEEPSQTALKALLQHVYPSLNSFEKTRVDLIVSELLNCGLVDVDHKKRNSSRTWAVPPGPDALKSYLGDLPQTRFYDTSNFYFPLERALPRHVDLASREFPSLWDIIGSERHPRRNLNICIVTPDIDGPTRTDIGAEYRRLAQLLQEAGHKITVLYMRGQHCEQGPIQKWVAHYAGLDINLVPLPNPEIPSPSGSLAATMVRPRTAYEWLKDKRFNVIHAAEAKGCVYVALTAKRLGLAFNDTLFFVRAWRPTLWNAIINARPIASVASLATTYMERKCIEYADVVVSPSRHLFRWMMRHGYDLPQGRCFVQPSLFPTSMLQTLHARAAKPVTEIVFVGSFEPAKGINAFLRALAILDEALLGVTITFLGQDSATSSAKESLLKLRFSGPFNVNVVDEVTAAGTINYLIGEGRMAVFLSFLDHSPFTLFECLAKRIPFLISNRGGAHEMIHEEDRPFVVCECTPAELATRIESILRHGAVIARPSFDPIQNLEAWKLAHVALAEPATRDRYGGQSAHVTWNGVAPVARGSDSRPLVSVCITHFNRPGELVQAIESIRQQTYKEIEVVVVDDGSSLPEAKACLEQLESQSEKPVRVIRQPNSYPGAARNTGIRNSAGEFILLMDDDNVAKPRAIETFLRAADFSGSDILCCYADSFTGPGRPEEGDKHYERITPVGDSISLGLFGNCFGDTNCFVRRRVFEALGGFTEDYDVGLDDYEFFLRSVLRGFKLMVVPEALYWYRTSSVRLTGAHFDQMTGKRRVFNTLLDNVPLCLYEALEFAVNSRDADSDPLPNRRRTDAREHKRDARIIKASGLFDADYYLKANPDIINSGIDPLLHFVRHGAFEGRKPNRHFDPANYVDDFPEVAANGVNPLVHYIRSVGPKVRFMAAIGHLLRERLAFKKSDGG